MAQRCKMYLLALTVFDRNIRKSQIFFPDLPEVGSLSDSMSNNTGRGLIGKGHQHSLLSLPQIHIPNHSQH